MPAPKPNAEIRSALVEGIRNNPEKSAKLKHAAERWIGVIDNIELRGADDETEIAFQHARLGFLVAAGAHSFEPVTSPAEIAKAFGLDPGTSQ